MFAFSQESSDTDPLVNLDTFRSPPPASSRRPPQQQASENIELDTSTFTVTTTHLNNNENRYNNTSNNNNNPNNENDGDEDTLAEYTTASSTSKRYRKFKKAQKLLKEHVPPSAAVTYSPEQIPYHVPPTVFRLSFANSQSKRATLYERLDTWSTTATTTSASTSVATTAAALEQQYHQLPVSVSSSLLINNGSNGSGNGGIDDPMKLFGSGVDDKKKNRAFVQYYKDHQSYPETKWVTFQSEAHPMESQLQEYMQLNLCGLLISPAAALLLANQNQLTTTTETTTTINVDDNDAVVAQVNETNGQQGVGVVGSTIDPHPHHHHHHVDQIVMSKYDQRLNQVTEEMVILQDDTYERRLMQESDAIVASAQENVHQVEISDIITREVMSDDEDDDDDDDDEDVYYSDDEELDGHHSSNHLNEFLPHMDTEYANVTQKHNLRQRIKHRLERKDRKVDVNIRKMFNAQYTIDGKNRVLQTKNNYIWVIDADCNFTFCPDKQDNFAPNRTSVKHGDLTATGVYHLGRVENISAGRGPARMGGEFKWNAERKKWTIDNDSSYCFFREDGNVISNTNQKKWQNYVNKLLRSFGIETYDVIWLDLVKSRRLDSFVVQKISMAYKKFTKTVDAEQVIKNASVERSKIINLFRGVNLLSIVFGAFGAQSFFLTQGVLKVKVIEAVNLPHPDFLKIASSNAFVQLSLTGCEKELDQVWWKKPQRTSCISRTQNPAWNETLSMYVSNHEVEKLEFQVFHKQIDPLPLVPLAQGCIELDELNFDALTSNTPLQLWVELESLSSNFQNPIHQQQPTAQQLDLPTVSKHTRTRSNSALRPILYNDNTKLRVELSWEPHVPTNDERVVRTYSMFTRRERTSVAEEPPTINNDDNTITVDAQQQQDQQSTQQQQ